MFKTLLWIILINFGINRIHCASITVQEYDEYEDYFKCKNGESIPEYLVCNGHKDCTDASDEFEFNNITASPCLKADCAHADAKCYYGACIPHQRWCDGKIDCADGSDEWKYFCKKSENPNKLSCESGEFISKDLFCDGKKDCVDGSDEYWVVCSLRKCGTKWRCRYGGCIDLLKKCDGRNDCYDGSDEDEYHAGCPVALTNKTAVPKKDGCRISNDENYEIYNDNEKVFIESGSEVPIDTHITIKCKNNFTFWHSTAEPGLTCGPSGWNGIFPRCYSNKFCDATLLTRSKSTSVTCKDETTPIKCERIRPKMTAEVSCADSYKMPQISREPTILMRCKSDYTWNKRKINCEPICGETATTSDSTASESPWHVGIYARFMKACGGTIVSPRLVITAWHCVVDENDETLSAGLIHVLVAGDGRNGSVDSTIKNVSKIIADRTYDNDVALLQLDIPLTLSENIRPICTTFSSADISSGEFGYVNGWSRHRRQNKNSLFKKTRIRTKSRNDCSVDLKDDQFCVHPNEQITQSSYKTGQLCQGDSGGGIIVHRDDKHYLIGIISYKPSHGYYCTTDAIVATEFMKIPEMLKTIIKNEEVLYDD